MECSTLNGLTYGVVVHTTIVVADNMQRIAMEVNRDKVGGHNDGGNKFLEKMEQLTPTTWAPSLG